MFVFVNICFTLMLLFGLTIFFSPTAPFVPHAGFDQQRLIWYVFRL